MTKDKSIIELIDKLKLIADFNLLQIVDHWDADLCAIGLKSGNRLLYISTYNGKKNDGIKYDYDLEVIDDNCTDKYEVLKTRRSVSEEELLSEILLLIQ